ncbi:aldo/keto reductase [Nosocomiicoccus massiliensis]|uniref:Aldo/keto reductase n=1 Tax=Nosocomiicoccus massiliensis TaxID=1232430 RepID=A0AAF0YLC8_9STAP|nr:aldo/keto reductase [Nosocomiicoccus massiliensis]WOS96507.1 aldo/keto reductase [Nosocomiicoccus massiliensis]
MKHFVTKDKQSISQFALGTMNLPLDDREELSEIIRLAFESCINYFDTADLYQYGKNEAVIGSILFDYGQFFEYNIGTKVGNEFDAALREKIKWNPSAEYIKHAVSQSKLRLSRDVIDLLMLHGGTVHDNMDETIREFESLKRKGDIKSYGISTTRKNVIDYYTENSDISVLMAPLNIIDNRSEEYLSDDYVFLARGPLMQGLLTENYDVALKTKFKHGYMGYSQDELREIILMIKEYGYPLEAIAYKYLMNKNVVIVQGVSTVSQLKKNLRHYETAKTIRDEVIEDICSKVEKKHYKEHRDPKTVTHQEDNDKKNVLKKLRKKISQP